MEHEIALALPHASHDVLRGWLYYLPHVQFERRTQLLNAYLDTPTQDLKQQKAALRLRFDSERLCWIQTLKTAGHVVDGVHVRQEWESVLPNAIGNAQIIPYLDMNLFPTEAQTILSPLLYALQPVFHTDFTREIYRYHSEGDAFELAFDYGQVYLAGHRDDYFTIINELEIEYKAGELEHMRQLARYIQAELDAWPQNLSKAARGYALMAK